MSFKLTVTRPFAHFKVGDEITDMKAIGEIRNGVNHANVVRVNLPDPVPVPAAKPAG